MIAYRLLSSGRGLSLMKEQSDIIGYTARQLSNIDKNSMQYLTRLPHIHATCCIVKRDGVGRDFMLCKAATAAQLTGSGISASDIFNNRRSTCIMPKSRRSARHKSEWPLRLPRAQSDCSLQANTNVRSHSNAKHLSIIPHAIRSMGEQIH